MKRLVAILLSALCMLFNLPAFSVTDENPLDSPLSSVSYSGRFSDVFSNPAALPLIETETGPFAFSLSGADSLDSSLFGSDPMPLLQNQKWNMQASFIARYVALTAFFGTEFERLRPDDLQYDIHSSLHIEVDMAYAVPHLSMGLRVSGGNKMIRQNRTIDSFPLILANAWFSPFKRDAGSEFFDLGVGAILEFSPFSAGVYVGKLLTLRNSNIYLGWDTLAESTTISMALEGGRFTKAGDLMLVRPRASFSLTGLIDASTRKIEAEGDITFQFLPDADFTIAISYLELHHDWFHFNADNGYVSIVLRGGADGFYGTLGVVFRATDFTSFSPTISFSYIS